MFMVLSLCQSSLGSSDECRTAPSGCRLSNRAHVLWDSPGREANLEV